MKWQFSLIVIAEYLFFCGLKKLFMWKVSQSGGRQGSVAGVFGVHKFSIDLVNKFVEFNSSL
jgi:hypothetical protein